MTINASLSAEELAAIADESAEVLRKFILAETPKICAASLEIQEQAVIHDTVAVVRLGFSIAIDLNEHEVEYVLGHGIRHKIKTKATMPDPKQLPLLN